MRLEQCEAELAYVEKRFFEKFSKMRKEIEDARTIEVKHIHLALV